MKTIIKKYFSKMFMLLPLTFLFIPFFYPMLGYHPEMPVFPLLAYLWFAFFLYLGMTAAFILPKYKYLAYPIIAIIAFLCRNIIALPSLHFQKTIIFSTGNGAIADDSVGYIIGAKLTPNEITYYTAMLFIMTLIIGFAGVYYSKKTALEFVKRGNTILFVNLWILCGAYYALMGADNQQAVLFVFCLAAFTVFYFIVRNFASLNRQIEIYGERGAYNATGTHRIYAYYFTTLLGLSIIPMILCFIVIPFIIKFLGYILRLIISLIAKEGDKFLPPEPLPTDAPDFTAETANIPDMQNRGNELLVYNILLIAFLTVTLILLIVFRKHIIKLIKEIIAFFKMKTGLSDFDKNNIINSETVIKVERDKKPAASYRAYLKKARKIRALHKRYAFAYNCVFWNIIRLEDDLKESFTPEEVMANIRNNADKSAKYGEVENLTYPYEDIKYGTFRKRDDKLKNMIDTAELLLKKILK